MSPKVLTFLGTRPEIIKLSPLIPLLQERFDHVLVHSGQHYSYQMDAVFFRELRLPPADYTLGVGSGGHGEQPARMLWGLEPILLRERPDMVLVQGDTNTTLAGGLAAEQRRQLDLLQALNREQLQGRPGEAELEAVG